MLKITFFIFSIFLAFSNSAQQNERIKKLQSQLLRTSNIQQKGLIYEEFAKAFHDINSDSVCYYANLCIDAGKKTGNKSILASGYHQKGVGNKKLGHTKKAIDLFYKGLKIREKIKEYDKVASSYLSIGNSKYDQGVLEEEKENFEEADSNYYDALSSYNKALKFAKKVNDSLHISKSYQSLGNSSYRLYEYKKAIEQYKLSYEWHPKNIRERFYGEFKTSVLACQIELDECDSLQDTYDEVVPYFKKYQQTEQWIVFNITCSGAFWKSDPKRSLELLIAADSMATSVNNIMYKIQVNRSLYQLNKELGATDNALKFHEIYLSLSDSVSNTETKSQIKKLELKYNKEKIEKKLVTEKASKAQAKAQNAKLWWAFGGTFFIALAIFIFLVQRQRIQRLKQKQDREKYNQHVNTILKDQELKSVEAMLEGQETERKRIAEDLHDRLGSTLSATKMYFESSSDVSSNENHDKVVSLLDKAVEDARDIAHNLVSGTLSKFGLFAALEDLKNSIEGTGTIQVDLSINASEERFHSDVEINLYRIVQEAFSNSLKHANATLLKVDFKQNNNDIQLIISDNGKGFDPKEVEHGMGLKNVKARVSKLNGELDLVSTKGTSYILSFKLDDLEE